ncbi:MAG: 2-(1,2-epoxy-1,2-dihydrophenyl)acetyl-CoA isomerase [Bacteroidetes bacterium]|jgi:2-(1,2-epoxy-1,2-dihydrophenyl)acetyl-CoA isomerase|nr:2-(1,2-epoxy-1,2-dihydrophenyl)acetyl-CoA isomerase [Bacteroidota bacterium]
MESPAVLYEKKGNVAHITLNRPDVFNAFNDDQSYQLQDALKQANKDEEVRVVVLTGSGKAFCSGQDLKAIAGSKNRSLSESLYKRYNPIIRAMREMPKPIIGRINGVAAGAGASLALACDFIIAAEHASLIEVFVNVGLVPDSGSSYFLPKAISPARAFEMCTMAQKVTAQQALEWGLINRVVAAEALDEEVAKAANYYATAPTLAIGMIKKMLNKATHSDLETMLQYEAYCQEIAGRSEDYREGVTAFNEKRKPEFKGK